MDAKTFGIGIKKLCAYYEKSIPPRETIELWLQKAERLPSECMPWIVAQITDSSERWPSNLPGAILKLWPQWLHAHPELRSSYSENGCTDCDSIGWLHVRDKDGLVCAFRCRCGKLHNSAPAVWLHELLREGYAEDTLDEAARWRVPSKGRSSSNINWSDYLGDLT